MKREIESLIVAAQNQSIRANLLKPRLIKSRKTRYTDCKKTDKSIDHIMSGCTKLAQEYKRRHDNLGKIIH